MSATQFKNSLKLTALASTLICGVSATLHADSAKLTNPANNHSYQRFDTVKTWTDAKIACESQGSHLATITSQAENDWIVQKGLNHNNSSEHGAWLGATDSEAEGVWQWITDEVWNYSNWDIGQPDNAGGVEHYLHYIYHSPTWNDIPVTFAFPYLCEWEIVSLPPLLSLNDINKDGAPEIAVVTYNPTLKKSTATVKNAQTGGLVQQIILDRRFVPIKANVLPDLNGNGAPEIAVLGVRSSDQAVQVEVRDSLSGVKLSAVPFDSTFTALDLGVVRDISGKGTAGLAVLQQSETELRVQLKNALSGVEIGNINFSAGYKGIDLLVLGDLNGNRAKEIAVLADNKTATAADTVEIRDSKTGGLIRTISYGTGKDLQQLINLPDLNNSGGAELAVLRSNTGRVLVKDAKTGLAVNTLDYAVSQPFRLATVADSNSQTNLAMLGVRAATGQPRADVHDPLSDTLINKVVFDNSGTTVGFIAIPDINGNGVAELVRLREQPGPQKLFAEVRDGRTGVLIQGMYF